VRQQYKAALELAAVLHSICDPSSLIRGAMVKALQDFEQASGRSNGLILIGPGGLSGTFAPGLKKI